MTSETCSGETPARFNAASIAIAPSLGAGNDDRDPKNPPNGDRQYRQLRLHAFQTRLTLIIFQQRSGLLPEGGRPVPGGAVLIHQSDDIKTNPRIEGLVTPHPSGYERLMINLVTLIPGTRSPARSLAPYTTDCGIVSNERGFCCSAYKFHLPDLVEKVFHQSFQRQLTTIQSY